MGSFDTFSGRFEANRRMGQATLVKKDADGNEILAFEGVFDEDMPQGQGQLTLFNNLLELNLSV